MLHVIIVLHHNSLHFQTFFDTACHMIGCDAAFHLKEKVTIDQHWQVKDAALRKIENSKYRISVYLVDAFGAKAWNWLATQEVKDIRKSVLETKAFAKYF